MACQATENVTVAPRFRQIVLERLESEKEQNLPPLACVELTQIHIEGILSAADFHESGRRQTNLHE